jgi:hypothetical protein
MSERKLLGYRVRWEGKYCTPPNLVFVEDRPFPVSRDVAKAMAKPLKGAVLVRVYAKPNPPEEILDLEISVFSDRGLYGGVSARFGLRNGVWSNLDAVQLSTWDKSGHLILNEVSIGGSRKFNLGSQLTVSRGITPQFPPGKLTIDDAALPKLGAFKLDCLDGHSVDPGSVHCNFCGLEVKHERKSLGKIVMNSWNGSASWNVAALAVAEEVRRRFEEKWTNPFSQLAWDRLISELRAEAGK